MMQFDHDSNVEYWQSEEFFIPYFDPTRQIIGHYYPDFKIRYKNGKTVVCEIKPHHQTVIPTINKKGKRKPLKEALLYAKNTAKWDAASKYCDVRGYEFKLITEKDLFKK